MKTKSKATAGALLVAVLAVTGLPLQAGDRGPDPAKVERYMAEAAQRLKLTPEQKDRLRPIVEEHVAQVRALRDKYPAEPTRADKRAMLQEMRTLRDGYDARVRAILDDAQEQEWQRMRAERRDRMREHMRDSRTGVAAPEGGGRSE